MNHNKINDLINIIAVRIKHVPLSPFNQSTNASDDDAKVVLPAVQIEANRPYWVAV